MRGTQPHYENGKDYDIIDVIRDYDLNFCRGNIIKYIARAGKKYDDCLLYTSPSPRDGLLSRMPSSA